MNKEAPPQKPGSQTKPNGEEERDNDAHRPDGSSGTPHDSTAQKTAREHGQQKSGVSPAPENQG
ncbi:hypothetical protein KSS93_15930 [Pseudomonas xanthosomatis]|uniref:hypothetical protein n=1 Tax=Pseudomonas xanthosomatis TaxID=2842356 RepID=UPI001C3C98D7|nr:hypothetical protein [Pseudomonas xanthosomatis]QXH44377.1 hypothetical protein KSS93_15930 [Pseudomonas xanthosomatis]